MSEEQGGKMKTKPNLVALECCFGQLADKVIEDNCRNESSFVIQDLLFRMSFDTYEKGIRSTQKKKKEKKTQNDLHKCYKYT